MSDRAQAGLRGPVKSCIEENTLPPVPDVPERSSEIRYRFTRTYDPEGHELSTVHGNSDGSQWISRNQYDTSGQLLKTVYGTEGKAQTETIYSYDLEGKLQKITSSGREQTPVVFHYDEHGRKTQVVTSLASDYRGDRATAGSPFEVAQMPPNLPGGGTATTIFDDNDRPKEAQIRDASGAIATRAFRTYDLQGRITEEKQVQENLVAMFPPDALAKLKNESGLSTEQLQQGLTAQLSQLMGGQNSIYSVAYQYDSDGRVVHASRRIFNHQEEIEITYNERGDPDSEITRSARPTEEGPTAPDESSCNETRYSYQYDEHGNWTERTVEYRRGSDGAFQSSSTTKRSLTYY